MKPDFFTYLHNLLASWVGRLNREAARETAWEKEVRLFKEWREKFRAPPKP